MVCAFVLTDTLGKNLNHTYSESYKATDAVISSEEAVNTGDTPARRRPSRRNTASCSALPYKSLAAFVVVAILAGVLAAILPARRASKLNVLEALQYE